MSASAAENFPASFTMTFTFGTARGSENSSGEIPGIFARSFSVQAMNDAPDSSARLLSLTTSE